MQKQPPPKDDVNRPETEEDGYRAAELRIAKYLRNNPVKRDKVLKRVRERRKT